METTRLTIAQTINKDTKVNYTVGGNGVEITIHDKVNGYENTYKSYKLTLPKSLFTEAHLAYNKPNCICNNCPCLRCANRA